MDIYKLIDEVKNEMGKIQKDGSNPHFKSKHMTIEGIHAVLNPLLQAKELYLLQTVRRGEKGMYLKTEVHYKEEEPVVSEMDLTGVKMQDIGSAITYARRYSIVALFGIVDKDDDGEQTMDRVPQHIIDKQKKMSELVGSNIDGAKKVKEFLGITNPSNKMTEKELDEMISHISKEGLK